MVSKSVPAGLKTQASRVNAAVSATSVLLRTRVLEPSKTIALPNRPAAVQFGEVAVAAVLLLDASATAVPLPASKPYPTRMSGRANAGVATATPPARSAATSTNTLRTAERMGHLTREAVRGRDRAWGGLRGAVRERAGRGCRGRGAVVVRNFEDRAVLVTSARGITLTGTGTTQRENSKGDFCMENTTA